MATGEGTDLQGGMEGEEVTVGGTAGVMVEVEAMAGMAEGMVATMGPMVLQEVDMGVATEVAVMAAAMGGIHLGSMVVGVMEAAVGQEVATGLAIVKGEKGAMVGDMEVMEVGVMAARMGVAGTGVMAVVGLQEARMGLVEAVAAPDTTLTVDE